MVFNASRICRISDTCQILYIIQHYWTFILDCMGDEFSLFHYSCLYLLWPSLHGVFDWHIRGSTWNFEGPKIIAASKWLPFRSLRTTDINLLFCVLRHFLVLFFVIKYWLLFPLLQDWYSPPSLLLIQLVAENIEITNRIDVTLLTLKQSVNYVVELSSSNPAWMNEESIFISCFQWRTDTNPCVWCSSTALILLINLPTISSQFLHNLCFTDEVSEKGEGSL